MQSCKFSLYRRPLLWAQHVRNITYHTLSKELVLACMRPWRYRLMALLFTASYNSPTASCILSKTRVTFCSTGLFLHTRKMYWWHRWARHDSKWVKKFCSLWKQLLRTKRGTYDEKEIYSGKFDQKMNCHIKGKNQHGGKHRRNWGRAAIRWSIVLSVCLSNGGGTNFGPEPGTNLSRLHTQKRDACSDSTASIFKFQSRDEAQMHV